MDELTETEDTASISRKYVNISTMKLEEHLDFVLNNLSPHRGYAVNQHKELRLMYLRINRSEQLELVFDILSTDGYIQKHPSTNLYAVTPLGRRFSALQGYVKQRRSERLRNAWKICIILATAINAIVVMYFTYLSIK